jgi:pimeloyl-ACP methyl ester carboxylesterase
MKAAFCFPLVFAGLVFAQSYDPQPPGQLIDLGPRKLHVECEGSGSPSVVVESGGGGFSVEWALVRPLVAKRTRICTYDRAGYAWSDHGPVDEDVAQVIDDLSQLARKVHIEAPFVLACQSLGCFFARAFQRRFPDLVSGLVFVDGSSDESITLVLNGVRKPIGRLTREQLPLAYEEYHHGLPKLNAGSPADPPFDRLPPNLQNLRHWAFEKLIRDMGFLPDSVANAESWREEFAALHQHSLAQVHPLGALPLVVLERGKDSDAEWHSQQLQLTALSSQGTLRKADGAGHMIHLDRPDLVAQAILEIVDRLQKTK